MSPIRRSHVSNRLLPAAKPIARPYDRLEQLPRLIGLWPSEMRDFSAAGTSRILALLRKAIRTERARGRAGHWAYDLNRHLALAESLKAERAHLRELDARAVAVKRPTTKITAPAPKSSGILHLPGRRSGIRRSAEKCDALPSLGQPVFLLPSLAESSS